MPRLFADSAGYLPGLLPNVERGLGRRVDGCFLYLSGRFGATPEVIAELRGAGKALAFCFDDLGPADVTSYAGGQRIADRAIAAAQALGLPASVLLAADVEESWPFATEFACGYANGQRTGPYWKAGGLYVAAESPRVRNAMAAARALDGNAELLELWAAAWQGAGGVPTIPTAWEPPVCAGAPVYAVQFWGQWQGVDLSLVPDGAPGILEPTAAGQFADVPPDAQYAPDVAAVARAGLMEGIGGGLFAPDGLVNRAQLATVVARLGRKTGII